MFPNWVGSDDVWPNKKLTVPFLVYWTDADIDAKAKDIVDDVTKRITIAGFGEHVNTLSEVVGGIASTSHHIFSRVVTGVVSSLVGRPMHYQHLLSARNARDALESGSDGITLDGVKLASSYVGHYERIARAILPP